MKNLFTILLSVVMTLFVFTACDTAEPAGPTDDQQTDQPTTPGDDNKPDEPNKPEEQVAYVDLGLSVKWATCNVGATKPEEYGDFFMWGDIDPTLKAYYDWSEYKYCDGSNNTLTKYCYDANYGKDGFVDNKLVLEPGDDAATAILGGQWRMPTAEERDELIDETKCHWEYVTVNGVKGARVTSKIKGYTDRSIFLPAAGYQLKAVQAADQEAGNYWCSSICTQTQYTDAPSNGCALVFSVTQKMNGYAWQKRFHGNNIRPVHP